MPLTRRAARFRTLVGWWWLTPLEWVMVALVAVLVVWGALPHYQRWRLSRFLEEEQFVVLQVRASLTPEGISQVRCPTALDTCPDSSRSGECGFFDLVLPEPLRVPGWRKADGVYIGPAGGRYRYEPRGCQFLHVRALPDTS